MPSPWFLDHLAVSVDADERAIKRAYAALLKQADPAADAAGFARLREAYELARAWVADRRETDEASETPEASVASADGIAAVIAFEVAAAEAELESRRSSRGALPPATEEAASIPAGLPDAAPSRRATSDHPQVAAKRLLDRLVRRIRYNPQLDIAAELDACAAELRRHHIDAPFLFEGMLLNAIIHAHVRRRVDTYAAAYAHYGWHEYMHLSSLGPAGAWVDAVAHEQQAFASSDIAERETLVRWLTRFGEGSERIPDDAALGWPRIRDAMARFPRYLTLYIDEARATEWQRRHAEAQAAVDEATHREARRVRLAKAARQRSASNELGARGAFVTLLVAVFFTIIGAAERPRDLGASTGHARAVRHIPGRTEAERSKAFLCMRDIDQFDAPGSVLTREQADESRACHAFLHTLENNSQVPH